MYVADLRTYRVPPRWILLSVRTDDGYEGWGEAIVPKRAGAVLGALDDLARAITGEPANRIEDLWQRMRRGGFFRGGPVLATATAAIEQALWDIKGQRYGLPVYEFLGGPIRESVRAYAWIGGDRPADVVEHASTRVAQGYTAVKMNATAELDDIGEPEQVDAVVGRVDALRQAFGNSLDIALDFHGRVHRPLARTLLRELEGFRLLWAEEPLPPGHEEALPGLAEAAGGTPIATGERLTSRWEFKRLLQEGAVDILQPDVSLTGLFELEKIARMAETYDVTVAPHCPNGPVSLAASLQVGCCATNIAIQEHSSGLHYHRGYQGLPAAEMTDYLSDPEPVTPVGGSLPRPAGPGLGIGLDTKAVRENATEWELPDAMWRHADGRLAEW